MFCYIHIPFCESKCKYCRFASTWNLQDLQIEKYIDFITKKPVSSEAGFSSIYFWWWTPWILNLKQIKKILNHIELWNKFNENIEITLESTPNKITKDNLIWWKKLWVNRLSIWAQSLNNKTLKEIWRWDKWDIIKSLDNIKEVWFDNISIDFIIWLPYVKPQEVKKNIEYTLNNYQYIKHISVYMLEDYYYPWNWEKVSIKQEEYLWEYIDIKNFLEEKGFNRYEVSNFAKSGYECKHNKAYWNHSEIKAIWLGSSWYEEGIRYSFPENFLDFYTDKNIFKEKLLPEDIFTEKVMFGLRTTWLDEETYSRLNGEKIEEFINKWYLKRQNKKLKPGEKWVLVLDYILKEILFTT